MAKRRFPSTVRALAAPAIVVVAALLIASMARYRLVEPSDLTASCDASPWRDATCTLRTLTVQVFAAQRLGIAAFAGALLATATRRRGIALLALGAACAGLVLYSTPLAAPAALLAALVLVRPSPAAGAAR